MIESDFLKNTGFQSAGFLNLTPHEAYKEATENNAIIVDVREETMIGYKQFGVPNVLYAPNSQLKKYFTRLPKDKPLIIADSAGLHSREAMQFLLSKGFTNIANLAGGLVEWDRDELPLLIDKGETLSGACVCRLRPRKKFKR
jgi:rhodanese-related sulfurtransferase